jgi:hypothetical protein
MKQISRFYLYWLILNLIGFLIGSLHGATSNGFIPSVIDGYAGLILGDLVFGGIVGLAQYVVFRSTGFMPASFWWILTTSIGFTMGARMGSLFTFRITENVVIAGILFGFFMGGSIGLTTAFALFKSIASKELVSWMMTNLTAWIAGESIAFAFHFSFSSVPIVALAIAGITGLGLIFLRPHLSAMGEA